MGKDTEFGDVLTMKWVEETNFYHTVDTPTYSHAHYIYGEPLWCYVQEGKKKEVTNEELKAKMETINISLSLLRALKYGRR